MQQVVSQNYLAYKLDKKRELFNRLKLNLLRESIKVRSDSDKKLIRIKTKYSPNIFTTINKVNRTSEVSLEKTKEYIITNKKLVGIVILTVCFIIFIT